MMLNVMNERVFASRVLLLSALNRVRMDCVEDCSTARRVFDDTMRVVLPVDATVILLTEASINLDT